MKYTEKELEFIHFAIDEYESNTQLARLFIDNFSSKRTLPSIIDKIRNVRKSTTPYDSKTLTKTNEYKNKKKEFVLSAWNEQGYMMDIEKYCEHYKLPRNSISSYKLVSHTGTPYYNIAFKEQVIEGENDLESIKEVLLNETERVYTYKESSYTFDKENVLKWSDLHFGAYIKNLMNVDDFSPDIQMLLKCALKCFIQLFKK